MAWVRMRMDSLVDVDVDVDRCIIVRKTSARTSHKHNNQFCHKHKKHSVKNISRKKQITDKSNQTLFCAAIDWLFWM